MQVIYRRQIIYGPRRANYILGGSDTVHIRHVIKGSDIDHI